MDLDKKHDKYCWECCEKGTDLKYCSSCPRSFHPNCILSENCVINLQAPMRISRICSVCKNLNSASNTKQELERIPLIFHRGYNAKCADSFRSPKNNAKRMKMSTEPDDDDDIINPIDLMQIKAKVEAKAFASLDEFLVDFQWFAHNYEIMYTNNDEKTKRAKNLLKLIFAEIDSVKTCLECHINANRRDTRPRWFTMVHRLPHLVIWAYKKYARYWPAKVMSFDDQHVKVYFFGGYHKKENVPVSKCYLYSENSPTNHSVRTNDTEFESALKEADQYIKNIREKYGAFELAETKTNFDPACYNDYVQNLISAVQKSPAQNGAINSNEPIASTSENPPTSVRSVKTEPMEAFEHSTKTNGSLLENTGQNGENDLDESMETSTEDPPQSVKYEPSISINDAEIAEESFTGQFEDINEEIEVESGDCDELAIESSLEYLAKGFRSIRKRNQELKVQMESVEEANAKLVTENELLKVENENQIKALKETHDQQMTQLKEEKQRLIEQQKLVKEQCQRECAQRIEEAKQNKYCMCCDNPKPQDIYICSMECQKRHWENASN